MQSYFRPSQILLRDRHLSIDLRGMPMSKGDGYEKVSKKEWQPTWRDRLKTDWLHIFLDRKGYVVFPLLSNSNS